MTPNNHDDLGGELGRQMHSKVDGMSGSPITLSDVKGTASRIRRHRALAAGAVAAVVAVIAVPTAFSAGNLFQGADGDPSPANPSVSPTQTATVEWPQRLKTDGLSLGDAPKITLRYGATLHTAGGETVPLGAPYAQVVPYDDGWLALDYAGEGGTEASVLDADGKPIGEPFATGQGFAAADDGSRVLYLHGDALKVHDSSTGETTTLRDGLAQDTFPIGFVGDRALYNVQLDSGERDARWIEPGGEEQDPKPNGTYVYADATDHGWAAALTKITDTGSCSETTAPLGNAVGRTCEFTLDTYSPDGTNLLAGPAYRDGYGDGVLAVLPRDSINGNPAALVHYVQSTETDATFMASTWEDDEHILVVTTTPIAGTADKMWGIVRVSLDGSVENAVEPVRADEFANPFGFVTN